MKKSVAVIGIGEMGGVFARGLLKSGHPVIPVTRDMELTEVAQDYPDLEAVVLGVGEKDLHPSLENIPAQWKEKLILLQNELLPRDWEQHGVKNPTVISVWFEKKPGQDVKVIIPSPVYGPFSGLIKASLEAINISCKELSSADDLLIELVIKNLYILTVNIGGLELGGGTVDELWASHNTLARAVANDVLDIQAWLTKQELDRQKLMEGMVEAFKGDLQHKCMGRSAPARLERALQLADEAGLDVPKLKEIARKQAAGQPSN